MSISVSSVLSATVTATPLVTRYVQAHWGYFDRSMPCTNDPGSCAYLDEVYNSHDKGMLASGIFWAIFGGTFLIWGIGMRVFRNSYNTQTSVSQPGEEASERKTPPTKRRSLLIRSSFALASQSRHLLLPDFFRPIFGRTTRLQVLILAIIAGYVLIWSFVSMQYKTWITPVKAHPGVFNTRSSIGSWANRVGILAYALTPISIVLASRESILTLLTGVPYQKFYFLHRWLGYIILVQALMHTVLRCLIDFYYYRPQPSVGKALIVQYFMVWGTVAFVVALLLGGLSVPWVIRRTGYEFFRKAHYVLALVYVGACIGHWSQLQCFLIPGILIWFFDRMARLTRTLLLNYRFLSSHNNKMGFSPSPAKITLFPDSQYGDVVRLELVHPHASFHASQHFFLCFTEGNIWQSHPFIPLPGLKLTGDMVTHTYIFRAKKGETRKIAELATQKLTRLTTTTTGRSGEQEISTPVILTGPYGPDLLEGVSLKTNILCVAGGTGITYVLALLLKLAAARKGVGQVREGDRRIVELVWVVRKRGDVEWVVPELDFVRERLGSGVRVRVFVTRGDLDGDEAVNPRGGEGLSSVVGTSGEKGVSSKEEIKLEGTQSSSEGVVSRSGLVEFGIGRPNLSELLKEFVAANATGSTAVFSSGPGSMISDLRSGVAACNSGGMVWNGDERYLVSLTCDDRAEF